MSGRNLDKTRKTKQTKIADTSPGSAEHGLCSFGSFGFFGFLEVSETSDNAWLDRTCAFFLPFFWPPVDICKHYVWICLT